IVSIKNDGHYFCRAGGNRPDGLNEPVTKRMINLLIIVLRAVVAVANALIAVLELIRELVD
ncbi:hypothetical protein ODS72_15315, partial [Escherichia coli]|nr:hypothetical protein [Escherichia coli]